MNNDSYNSLQNTDNANNVSKTCVLYTLGASNLPSNVGTYGYLTTLVASPTLKLQTYNPYNSRAAYKRICDSGTWTSWAPDCPEMVFLSNSQTRSTSFVELNDMRVYVPAGTYFIATLRLFYEYSSVAEIGIGNYSSSSIEDGCQVRKVNSSAYGYVHNPSVTYTGYTATDMSIIGYGRWASSASNRAQMFVMKWPAGSYTT